MKKIEIAIFIAVLALLAIIWAVNGYDDTWFYVTAAVIAIPVSWLYFNKKHNDQ